MIIAVFTPILVNMTSRVKFSHSKIEQNLFLTKIKLIFKMQLSLSNQWVDKGVWLGCVENGGYLVYVKELRTVDWIMHIAQHCTHTHTPKKVNGITPSNM